MSIDYFLGLFLCVLRAYCVFFIIGGVWNIVNFLGRLFLKDFSDYETKSIALIFLGIGSLFLLRWLPS